jgi:iron only hydrogenase large subunit-like protein
MAETARLIKRGDSKARVIFIGPCSSKKLEYASEKIRGAVDGVLSFEELQAFLDARDVDVASLPETVLDNASFYGRIFAKSGGIARGVADAAERLGASGIIPTAMNGIDECNTALTKLKFGRAAENFFEGMACEGGCLNGALCLNRGPKNLPEVDKYGAQAKEKDIFNSVKLYELSKKSEE